MQNDDDSNGGMLLQEGSGGELDQFTAQGNEQTIERENKSEEEQGEEQQTESEGRGEKVSLRRYYELIRNNSAFSLLLTGTIISNFGDWFNEIGCLTLIGNGYSSVIVSTYLIVKVFPFLFFSSIAGVVADSFDRRKVMIIADFCRFFVVLLFLTVNKDNLWLLFILQVLQMSVTSFFIPASEGFLPLLLKKEDLLAANNLMGNTWSVMLFIGASVGGFVTSFLGVKADFIIDSFSYLASAFFLWRIAKSPAYLRNKTEGVSSHENDKIESKGLLDSDEQNESEVEEETEVEQVKEPRSKLQRFFASTKEGFLMYFMGLKFLSKNKFILFLAMTKGMGTLVWTSYDVLYIRFAENIFRIGEGGVISLSIIWAFSGLGVFIFPYITAAFFSDNTNNTKKMIVLGFSLLTCGCFLFSVTHIFPLFVAFTVIRAGGSGVIWVYSGVLLQRIVPSEYMGRVFAFEFAFLTLTGSLGVLMAGISLDYLSLTPFHVSFYNGILSLLILIPVCFLMWKVGKGDQLVVVKPIETNSKNESEHSINSV